MRWKIYWMVLIADYTLEKKKISEFENIAIWMIKMKQSKILKKNRKSVNCGTTQITGEDGRQKE